MFTWLNWPQNWIQMNQEQRIIPGFYSWDQLFHLGHASVKCNKKRRKFKNIIGFPSYYLQGFYIAEKKIRIFVICFNFTLGNRKWNTCFVDIFNIFNRDFTVLCPFQILFPHFFSDIFSRCFISWRKSEKTFLLWSHLKVWTHQIVGKSCYSLMMIPFRKINLKSVQTLFLCIYK